MPRIDLWQWSLDIPEQDILKASKPLSDDEMRRADRFVKPIDRRMYIAGRSRLRKILGRYLGLAAKSVSFDYGPHGKPMLADGPGFNLSHSGGRAVLAVSEDGDLGLDIEKVRPIEDAVARHNFSPAEYAELSELPEAEWLNGFFRCWTRKEAVLKRLGYGLYMPLDSFDVTVSQDVPPCLTRIEGDNLVRWALVHLDLGPGWIGALALRDAADPVQLRWREADELG